MTHRCETHRLYYLTCIDYDRLVHRAGNCCEVCRTPPPGVKPLFIDHDHALGRWAVRGLLCNRCNSGMVNAYRAPRWAEDYLSRPFHVEVGLQPPNREVTEWSRLNLTLPASLYSAIRAIATSKDQTISEYVRAALEDAYARDRYGMSAEKTKEAGQ